MDLKLSNQDKIRRSRRRTCLSLATDQDKPEGPTEAEEIDTTKVVAEEGSNLPRASE